MTRHLRGAPVSGALIGASWLLILGCAGVVVVGVTAGLGASNGSAASQPTFPAWSTAAKTVALAGAVATVACVLGLPVAWAMRGLPRRFTPLLIAPIVLPNYLIYTALSLFRAPGTWLGDRLEGGSATFWEWFAIVQAVCGLGLWSWPLAAGILHVSASRIEREAIDAAALAGAGPVQRVLLVTRQCREGILCAWGVVAALMLGSAVPFHLSQVETYATVVWRTMAESAGSAAAWRAAAPLLVVASLTGAAIGLALLRSGARGAPTRVSVDRDVGRAWLAAAALLWGLTSMAPIGMLGVSMQSWREFAKFAPLAGGPLLVSLALSAFVAAACGLIAVGTSLGLVAPMSVVRRTAGATVVGWLAGAVIPGVLVGAAVAAAGSTRAGRLLTDSWLGVVGAHIFRFGALGAIAGWWVTRSEPRDMRDLRLESGATDALAWTRTVGAMNLPVLGAATLGAGILSFHEIESTVMAAPAGGPTFAQHMLSLLHYLRDDQLAVGGVVVGGVALLVGVLTALILGLGVREPRRFAAVVPLGLAMLMVGCDDEDRSGRRPIEPRAVFGEVGRGDGQFVYPRAIDSDGASIFVVDKTARVQRFGLEGTPQSSWMMPAYAKGYPTGLTCGPDGLVYIADTHEHRIAVFHPTESAAEMVDEWGGYGEGDGKFIFPTDVAVLAGSDGRTPERIYVSEYGGNDRVSAFDGQHRFLFSFGAPGFSPAGEAVRFNRPQSIVCDRERQLLLVADAANHRIGRFRLDGTLDRWLGSPDGMPSRDLGRFSYPYGLALLPDGSLLVAEYGGGRLQRIDPATGACLGIAGVPGRGRGELASPWGVATSSERVFILDSGNSRVVECRAPRGGGQG